MFQVPELACQHAPGEGSAQSCAFLRAVLRVRAWADRAERAYHSRTDHTRADHAGFDHSALDGELWLLVGEVQSAYHRCPDHSALVESRRDSREMH